MLPPYVWDLAHWSLFQVIPYFSPDVSKDTVVTYLMCNGMQLLWSLYYKFTVTAMFVHERILKTDLNLATLQRKSVQFCMNMYISLFCNDYVMFSASLTWWLITLQTVVLRKMERLERYRCFWLKKLTSYLDPYARQVYAMRMNNFKRPNNRKCLKFKSGCIELS